MPPAVEFLRGTYGLHGAFLILGAIMWNGAAVGMLLRPRKKSIARLKTENEDGHDSNKLLLENSSNGNANSCTDYENSFLGLSAITHHPLFGLSVIVHSLTNFNFVIWALYLVPYGISLGYHPQLAALLSTSGGAGGFIGKVLVIVVFHHGRMTQIISNAVPGIIYGIALAGYILCDNYDFLLIFSFMSGFSLAFADASTCAMIPRYICSRHLRPGIVLFYFCGGVFTQLGGIIAGIRFLHFFRSKTTFCPLSLP
ncbi:hypothetical protein HOLleu_23961 [Holothuria leucospilota]|uniref:Monocarboxylate transporter n=1 Tax=Holothuria leucospilota TaxID=206669 RepID=A0A9Q1BW36_HOLLE|nr:hypothetical protein HOLleu_23961 [Holothuria leucospilota]